MKFSIKIDLSGWADRFNAWLSKITGGPKSYHVFTAGEGGEQCYYCGRGPGGPQHLNA